METKDKYQGLTAQQIQKLKKKEKKKRQKQNKRERVEEEADEVGPLPVNPSNKSMALLYKIFRFRGRLIRPPQCKKNKEIR